MNDPADSDAEYARENPAAGCVWGCLLGLLLWALVGLAAVGLVYGW